MKKKGLIISTVVMVVVLIAALTTTTFAWFTTEASNKIDDIQLTVASNADVVFGLKKDGKWSSSTNNESDFVSGSVTFTAGTNGKPNGTWQAGVDGLTSLTLPENVGFGPSSRRQIDKAVGTTISEPTSLDAASADAKFDATHTIVVAQAGANDKTMGTPTAAVENQDYIHLMLGIKLVGKDKDTLNCKIELKFSAPPTTLGLAAGMHVVYRLNSDEFQDKEFYEAETTYQTKGTDRKEGKTTSSDGDGSGLIEITGLKTDGSINNLELFIFLDGVDGDTITAAALQGLNASIAISFPSSKSGD